MPEASNNGSISDGFLGLLRGLTPEQQDLLIATLSPVETGSAGFDWASWAHRGQYPPPGDWRTWVMLAGRGFGKTRAGAEWVARQVRGWANPGETLRIALVAATIDEARRVMIEGDSGLLAVAGDEVDRFYPSRRLLRFAGGAEATLFSGASPEALRGPQHHFAWCDELAKWEQPEETWAMLQLGLRLGDFPRALVTTTPKPGAALRAIMAQHDCVTTGGATRANVFLPPAFVEAMEELYGGTRRGRQELEGELLPDAAGALWKVEVIEGCRVASADEGAFPSRLREGVGEGPSSSPDLSNRGYALPQPLPQAGGEFSRLVIAVDPPSGDGTCGIIACARDAGGIAHILADHSVTGRSPDGWARAVASAALAHGTREVVAEANQGGKMVRMVLLGAEPGLQETLVTATQGKALRAEPVARLFEAGKVRLHGPFAELEAELLGMIAGGGYEGPGMSPDRADAMVWGVTELVVKGRGEARVRML